MTFAEFIARVYSRVPLKHSQTLVQLRELTVQQLAEMTSRRVVFTEATVELDVPSTEPYNGEWAGPGLPGFPLDLLEIRAVYVKIGGTGWQEVDGPIPIDEIRILTKPLAATLPAFQLYPSCYAWWEGKIWLGRLAGPTTLKLDYYRDGRRDGATGVPLTTASTVETNPWLDRGADALEYAVLAAYYALPSSTDMQQVEICNAQTNAYLGALASETRAKTGASFQAPFSL